MLGMMRYCGLVPSKWGRVIVKRRRRFSQDDKGLAAVEFAMIAPMLIGLLIGAVEVGTALTVDRRVASFASAAADLVSQTDKVSKSDLKDVFELSRAIMVPYGTSKLKLTLSSVVADEDNVTTVEWSEGLNGGTALAEGANYKLPNDLTQAYSSVVVSEVDYEYTSPFSWYITGPITMSATYFLRPRKSPKVEKTD